MPKIVELDILNTTVQQDILALQRKAYALEEELIGFPIPRMHDTPEHLLASDEIFIGMVQDGTLLGMLAFTAEENALDIQRVAVDPDYFRQGVASDLIQFLFDAASDSVHFLVTAGAENTPAVQLYGKMGFYTVSTIEPIPGLIMLKMRCTRTSKTV